LQWYKLPLFVLSLFLFVLAISLMKDGAGSLGPLVRDRLHVTGFGDALGFGWLLSYLLMSGSPVAGTALAFLDAGVVDRAGAFGMIVGSRLGGSFIVLFIGFLYVLRGRNAATSLTMGLLSMAVAWTIQSLAVGIGLFLLDSRWLDGIHVDFGTALASATDLVLEPIGAALAARLPGWGVFVVGLGVITFSFSLFDRCLPEMTLKASRLGRTARLVYRPWVMFLLGSAITLVSMSVSISLGLLVPLSQRGFVRRENAIPYIMGANISTFIDTLLAAVLIGNPAAFTVVLTEMASLFAVSTVILGVRYGTYEHALLRFVDWTVADRRHLAAVMAGVFLAPLALLLGQ